MDVVTILAPGLETLVSAVFAQRVAALLAQWGLGEEHARTAALALHCRGEAEVVRLTQDEAAWFSRAARQLVRRRIA